MISNVNKNVICVKNIPSNIIEEAIFILKEDVSENMGELRIDIAKGEAEMILQEYIENEIVDKLEDKVSSDKKNNKKKKMFFIMICVVAAVLWLAIK